MDQQSEPAKSSGASSWIVAATAVTVLANDTDLDGGPISIASVTQPANGTVVITGGGTGLTYQPNANYANLPPGTSPDTFTYTLGGGSTASVSISAASASGSLPVRSTSAPWASSRTRAVCCAISCSRKASA